MPVSLAHRITKLAHQAGFERAALLPAPLGLRTQPALQTWLSEGRHGQMGYLAGPTRRDDAQLLLEGARCVLVVAKSYKQPLDLLEGGLRIARYAHNEDYHEVLRARLAQLAHDLESLLDVPVRTRAATDSAPLLERELAQRAGLGWVGKNTMLIDPQIGSFFLIAELLIDAPLSPLDVPSPAPDRCGSCTRCIDACPTQAIVAPGVLDARRCLSYLTIEYRGIIPRQLRPLIGDYLFGCDICQDVCPWNTRPPSATDPAFATRDAYRALSPRMLLGLTRRQFNHLFKGSPIQRTRRQGLLRNAAVVVGNSARAQDVELLSHRLKLEPDPIVRVHLGWALAQHPSASALAACQHALAHEPDAQVRDELEQGILAHPLATP